MADLQRVPGEWAEAFPNRVEAAGFILDFGYDDARLAEQRYPTRAELDAVTTELPVLVVHQSGHIGVANSRGLDESWHGWLLGERLRSGKASSCESDTVEELLAGLWSSCCLSMSSRVAYRTGNAAFEIPDRVRDDKG